MFTVTPAGSGFACREHPAIVDNGSAVPVRSTSEFFGLCHFPAVQNNPELRFSMNRCLRFICLRVGNDHLSLESKAERTANRNLAPRVVRPLQRENFRT